MRIISYKEQIKKYLIMNKEEVLEELEVMGFDVEEVPDLGYIFKHGGLSILFMPDDDENFLRFAAPNVFDVTDENRAYVMDVVNDTNMTIKYSKVCVYGEQVWALYEYCLLGIYKLDEIIEHCIHLICATVALFHRKVEGEDPEELDDDE